MSFCFKRNAHLVAITMFFAVLMVGSQAFAAAFTSGDITVLQLSSTSNNNTGSILELSPTTPGQASPIQTIAISPTGAAAMRFMDSGTSSYLSRTNDGTLLVFTGYNSTDTTTTDLSAVNALNPASDRSVGTLDTAGNFALQTTYTGITGNQTRSASSLDNVHYFIADKGGLYTNSATAPSFAVNIGSTRAFGGAAYILSTRTVAQGAPAALMTAVSPTATSLTALPGIGTDASINDFYMIQSSGSTFDVVYILDGGTSNNIKKFSLVGGTWTANGSYSLASGGLSLVAANNGSGGASLYVITATGPAGNSVVKLTDTAGYNAAINVTTANNITLFTSTAPNTLKGIELVPAPLSVQSDLAVSSLASNPVSGAMQPGSPLTYTLKVKNLGAATSNIKVNFTLPASGFTDPNQSTQDSGFGAPTVNAGVVSWTGGSLALNATATLTYTIISSSNVITTGSVVVDPDNTITESNESNNTLAGITVVANDTPPVITGLPQYLSGAIGDPHNSVATFTVTDAQTATSALNITISSSNPTVVPNDAAHISLTVNGNTCTVAVTPAAVGIANLTVTVNDPGPGAYHPSGVINYAASGLTTVAGSTTGVPTLLDGTTRYYYGMSNASGAILNPNDPTTLIIADDEPPNDAYIYNQGQSAYPIVAPYDFSPGTGAPLRLKDSGKECDFEALMLVGTRAFYMGSQSNDSSGNLAVNRARVLGMDISGAGNGTTLTFAGRYDNLRNQIINWDHTGVHGLGVDHFGLYSGSFGDAKLDTAYDFEGLALMPGSSSGAFMAFRAPIVGTDKHALVLPVTNFTTMATSLDANAPNDPATTAGAGTTSALGVPPVFGSPVELDLGGRGVRDIIRNNFDEYLIIGGSTGDPANTKDFRLFRWDGVAGHPAIMCDSYNRINQDGMTPEAILNLSASQHFSGATQVWLLSDNGTRDFYGDGQEAKAEPQNWQKSRADLVSIGNPVVTISGSFPNWNANVPYSNQLTVTDSSGSGTGSAVCSILTGSLPPGLNLSASGLISGTPTTAGTYNFTVLATYPNGQGLSGQQAFSLTIIAPQMAVAAGDVTASDVILWTHVVDPNAPASVAVTAEVATDNNFANIVTTLNGNTNPAEDYTLKVNPTGLSAGTRYYYRLNTPFGYTNVGTFKTAYAPGAQAPVHFAFSGDADGKWRPFPSVDAIGTQNLDFFEFAGDTMYENAASPDSPMVTAPEVDIVQCLAGLRRKYRENILAVNPNGAQGLKNFFASQANYTLLDNHELCSNLGKGAYQCGGAPNPGATPGLPNYITTGANDINLTGPFTNKTNEFIQCVRAFRNYEPIREDYVSAPADPRSDGTLQMYKAQQWGKNLLYVNTDCRSYADVRMSGTNAQTTRGGNPLRTRLGATQLAWLKQLLLNAQNSGTTWKIITVSDPIDQQSPNGVTLPNGITDGPKSWEGGYRAERNDLLKFIADNHITNVVFLATDDHQNRVNELLYAPDFVNAPNSRVYVPGCFTIVAGPIGASGPELVTGGHGFANLKSLADAFASQQKAAGVNPLGLDPAYPGLHNVVREGDPDADTLRQPIDFYSPDTFNYATLDISADGKTLTVKTFGIDAFNPNLFKEASETGPVREVLSFQVDAGVSPISASAGNASGLVNTPIPLTINYALINPSFPQTVSVKITGVPDAATLSAGSKNVDGSWTLTGPQLTGLTLTTPAPASIPLTALLTDLDGSNTAIGTASANLTVTVVQKPSIGNFCWHDLNGNGIQDADEPGFAGVVVELHNSADAALVASTTSGADGSYIFTNVEPGSYYLKVIPPNGYSLTVQDAGGNTAASDVVDSDPNPSTFDTDIFNVNYNDVRTDLDAGFTTTGALSGVVFNDANFDGQNDNNEPTVANIKVELWRGGVKVADTQTAATGTYPGSYYFGHLDPGNDYELHFIAPNGAVWTLQGLDSDVNELGVSNPITVTSGGDAFVDAGLTTSSLFSLNIIGAGDQGGAAAVQYGFEGTGVYSRVSLSQNGGAFVEVQPWSLASADEVDGYITAVLPAGTICQFRVEASASADGSNPLVAESSVFSVGAQLNSLALDSVVPVAFSADVHFTTTGTGPVFSRLLVATDGINYTPATGWTSHNQGAATLSLTGLAGGHYTVLVESSTNSTGPALLSATSSDFTVPVTQTIAFDPIPNHTFGDSPITVSATASSGLPVTFSIVSGPASVTGNLVTLNGAGTILVQADQAGNENYTPASAQQTFTVSKATQTITFNALPAFLSFTNAPVTLTATASSGLTVSLTLDAGNGTINGNQLTLNGVGTFKVRAKQAGDANYQAASDVVQTMTVLKGNQAITFADLGNMELRDPAVVITPSASSGLPVTVVSNSSAATVTAGPGAGQWTLTPSASTTGNVKITVSQAGNANWNAASSVSQTFKVTKRAQTIDFPEIADAYVTDPPIPLLAVNMDDKVGTPLEPLPIAYTVTGPGTLQMIGGMPYIKITGAGTIKVTASQPGDGLYDKASSVSQTIKVNKLTQSITFPPIPAQTLGAAPFNINVTSSAGAGYPVILNVVGPATVTSTAIPGQFLVTLTGAGAVHITATQPGDDIYTAAPTVKRSLNVAKASPSITLTSSQNPSTPHSTVILTATVTGVSGIVPTGQVTFKVSGVSTKVDLDNQDKAQLNITSPAPKTVTITSSYSGDANFTTASASISQN